MTPIERRLHFPADLHTAVAAYAGALQRGDAEAGSQQVTDGALEAHRAAFDRVRAIGPFGGFEVIARARLGFQHILKIRLHGLEHDLTLQCRWREEKGVWRIAEIDDVGLRSPWLKTESPTPGTRTADG